MDDKHDTTQTDVEDAPNEDMAIEDIAIEDLSPASDDCADVRGGDMYMMDARRP